MMEARLSTFARALLVSCLFSVAFAADSDFPTFDDLEVAAFSTEVQLDLVKEKASVYVKEYYDNIEDRGSVTLLMQGSLQSVYYDNSSNEILDVNKTHCQATEVDISEFTYTPLYHGWLSTNPLVVGPSAPLSYAQKFRDKIVKAQERETVRDIPCDKWELKVENKVDNYTIHYYFAPEAWTTPYQYKKLRIPIRIRIVGTSSRYTGSPNVFVDVDQISDFAFFKPTIDDLNSLLPPIGIGCRLKEKSDRKPAMPQKFQFSTETVNRIEMEKQADIEIGFETIWYDYLNRLARFDQYTKKSGYKSALYDFKGGAAYYILNDGSCQISTLKDTEFMKYDLGIVGAMEEPDEALFLDGNFYEMGKREIRGIRCDTFEKVEFDTYFHGEHYYKLVVTVYFTEPYTRVGVNGKMESQIPVYMIINGWSTETNRSLSLSGSIFGFDDVIWPAMYESFALQRCYTKPETKAYFVVIMEVDAKNAAIMEGQNELVIKQLRSEIARAAKVPELRIPYLKADYKSTGVYVQGVIIDRAPAQIQFDRVDTGTMKTNDPDLKVVPEAETLEECAYSCIDEGDFTCKGYYFCNKACFLKSIDIFEIVDNQKETELGVCEEYIRTARDSTNYKEVYLAKALENLETAILNQTVSIIVDIPSGEGVVTVSDIVVGDGPYTGVDSGDKPFTLAIEWRKLDASLETIQTMTYADTLTDCYKQCKEVGSACASFSFCPDTPLDDKQCLITPELVVKGKVSDTDLVPDKYCNIYHLKYSDYFEPFPEKISIIPGDKEIRSVTSLEKCAQYCRMEDKFVCRGFEFCKSMKTCNLHKKHILDFKEGEYGKSHDNKCVHYAARYIADYMDLGPVLIDDNSNVRYSTSLEECAKTCSVELKDKCKSFNYCLRTETESTCALSDKLLRDDGVVTTEKKSCLHYEKRDVVHDWDITKARLKSPDTSGYTSKGFTGLVIGMLALGLVIGAVAFVGYSYVRSRGSGDGTTVRFMKNAI